MMVLRGEVDLIFPDDGPLAPDGPRRMRRGDFVYYPVGFSHTLKTVGEIPANYLMVKWSGPRNDSASPLTFQAGSVSSTVFSGMTPGGFSSVVAFEGATEYLKKFHVHISCVAPHGGYGAHRDPHDVVMVILEGEAETVGRRVRPGSVIYYASGEAHGLSNFSSGPVRYVVLEFHGRTVSRLHSAWEQLRRSFR